MMKSSRLIGGLAILATVGCGGSSPTAPSVAEAAATPAVTTAAEVAESGTPVDASSIYALFASTVEVSIVGSTVVIRTEDIPDHASPYFGAGDPRYESPDQGMVVNPNRILAQSYEFRIPTGPQTAAAPSQTSLDAIGVAVNGVVMFNQYAGRDATGFIPLDREIETFDRYGGHPAGQGNYHYHVEPTYITQSAPSGLVGVLLDGFPVYGPTDMDGTVAGDLDECNGHTGATTEHSDGIYHYHVTAVDPYISGCYKGTPGSVTN